MAFYTPFSGAPKFSHTIYLDAAAVGPKTVLRQTFTLKGIRMDGFPLVNYPEWPTNTPLVPLGARIPANDTLEITIMNLHDSQTINLASQPMHVLVL